MAQDLKATVGRMFDEVVNQGRLELVDELFDPDFRTHTPQGVMNLDEFRPPETVTYDSTQAGLPAFRHERHFADKDGSLEYTLVIAFQPRRGPRGIVDRLFVAPVVKRSLTETLDNLESIFRARAA